VQIGNAVPPLLAEVLAGALARQLGVDTVKKRTLVRPGTIPPPPKDPVTRKTIQIRKPVDSRPPAVLRRNLHALRIRRFRTDAKPIPNIDRVVDLVFPTAKVAVFVHECFWHGCKEHETSTLSKSYWWKQGIDENVRAFERAARQLRARGWKVLRLWEHQRPDDQTAQVLAMLRIRAPELMLAAEKTQPRAVDGKGGIPPEQRLEAAVGR
jgi:DNA mismatch endonuclease (patch repair protein)